MLKKPTLLKKGDKIGIVAPGAAFNRKKFRAGIAFIRSLGLIPVLSPHLFKKDFIFAGTISQRVSDLKKFLARQDVKALWCVRGGYGTYAVAEELARQLEKKSFLRHPKVILGHSDILALHLLCIQNWKWPALHGPLVDRIGKAEVKDQEKDILKKTLLDGSFRLRITKGLKTMGRKGEVTGVMTGGNLALLAASLKTRWEVNTDGKILFLEEIGERAYRLDRFLFQLKTAGKLDKLRGVVIGDFTECQEPDGKDLSMKALARYFKGAPYPVLIGVRSGHGPLRLTLPLGLKVRISTKTKPFFQVMESYSRG